jgi:predicted double-glycine peptidase
MVLNYFGVNKSEKELAKLCNSSKERGTKSEDIVKAAKKFGFKSFIKDHCDFKDIRKYVLKQKIPIIVNWFSEYDGHYSVIVDIDSENIYLQDPEIGHLKAIELKHFKRVWFDFPTKFLKSKNELNIRRIIIIKK